MSKKSRDTLTGGTGDVNPQYACISGTTAPVPSAGSVSVSVPIVLPVVTGYGQAEDTAQCVELLKIDWDFGGQPQIGTAQTYSTTSLRLSYNAGTASNLGSNGHIGNPLIIDEVSIVQQGIAPAGQGFAFTQVHNASSDLTDGAGHGILVAVPTIWLGIALFGWPQNGVGFGACRIYYRVKRIKLIEFIGIVQQQSGPQI